MNKRKLICDEYQGEKLLFADDLDDAIIGVSYDMANGVHRIVYSENKCIEILKKQMEVKPDDLEEGQSVEDKQHEMALEYFEFNIAGAYVGVQTPVWVYSDFMMLDDEE